MDIIKTIHSTICADVFTLKIFNSLFQHKSEQARKALLKRACQKGDLIRIRNGLYLVGHDKRRFGFSPYTLANLMVTPSYISLESALSHYGLIPERVEVATSVTTGRPLTHSSPIGDFSFSHLKSSFFNFGFYQQKEGELSHLIATPLKALIDYIVIRRKHYQCVNDMEGDIRLDWEELVDYKEFVNIRSLSRMLEVYKSHRMKTILKDMRKRL